MRQDFKDLDTCLLSIEDKLTGQLQGEVCIIKYRVSSIETNVVTVEASLKEFDEDLGAVCEDPSKVW